MRSQPPFQQPHHHSLSRYLRIGTSWLALTSLVAVSYYPLSAQAQTTVSPAPVLPSPVDIPIPPTIPTTNGTTSSPAVTTPNTAPSSITLPRTSPGLVITPTPPVTQVAPALIDEGYLLGAGDRIRMDIFNVPEYSGEFQVLADGTLNLPLVGTVPVQGMTLTQASSELANRYIRYLRRPLITLSLLATRPIKLAIAGEVGRPGAYVVAPTAAGGGGDVPTVTRLIQQAGGVTQAANIREVKVRRLRPMSNGIDQVIILNLQELVDTGNLRQDIVLRDGDSVFIPTASEINLAEARQRTSVSFRGIEALPIKVAVIGEVSRPGPQTLQADEKTPVTTVTSAIAVAGGINQVADIRRIQVRRPTHGGGEQLINANLWALLVEGDLNQDIPLQDGDTVIIPTATELQPDEIAKLASASFAPAEINVNVVGEVVRPGALKLLPNTPLNTAVLAAGGFNTRAQSGSVELVRVNPNGTVTRRSIGFDLARGINEENNPPLRNNDTIVVSKSTVADVSDVLNLFLTPITSGFGVLRLFGILD